MRAQFVRGADPKDTMDIGNKHAREGQKMIAAFKEIDSSLDPKITDDKTTETFEMVIVNIILGYKNYSLAWVKSGLEYYIASWGNSKGNKGEEGGQDTFPKLEQAKRYIQKYIK